MYHASPMTGGAQQMGQLLHFGAPAKRNPAVQQLQAAIRALGTAVRDKSIVIAADGVLGPGTARAVNIVFTRHIGPGQAPANYRTGALTVAQIASQAATMTQIVQRELSRRAGMATVPAPAPRPGAPAPRPGATAPAPVATAKPTKAMIIPLQQALVYLSQQARDRSLALKVDGALGPGTARAVNRAMSVHVGPGQAPANLRTGALTIPQIAAAAPQLAQIIRMEALRRQQAPARPGTPTAPTRPGAPAVPAPAAPSKATAIALQQALVYLSQQARDKSIAVKVDGKIGPGTAKATNRAMTVHVGPGQAVPALRTGALTVGMIASLAGQLAQVIRMEAYRRQSGGGAAPRPGAPMPGPAVATGPVNRTTLKVLQTRLAQLGRVKRDANLMIKADGAIGPKTVAAANRALTAYVGNAPPQFRTGALTAGQIAGNAQAIAAYVGQALSAEGTSPATAPPAAEVGPNAEGEGAAIAPGPSADEGMGPPGYNPNLPPEEGAAPPPPPPPPRPGYDEGSAPPPPPPPPSPGPTPEGGGVEPQRADLVPGGEPGKFPLVPVLIGVGVAAAAVVVVIVMKKSSSGAPTYAYKQPARKRAA